LTALLDFLATKLAAGSLRIGEVLCSGGFRLCHMDDAGKSGLEIFTCPEAALDIVRFDAGGNYRPLRAAPNLKSGWEIQLEALSDVRLALDFFYPAALGNAHALERDLLSAIDLRETLDRQTGMYAVTKKATDEDLRSAVIGTCEDVSCCRNKILWNISPSLPTPLTWNRESALGEPVPLLCTEACPVLVAAIRKKVKARQKAGTTPPPES
jgi:sirohydrochlorin cobaltochelatase